MTNMIRCPGCCGQKKVSGIGWMEVECMQCAGVGRIAAPVNNFEVTAKGKGNDSRGTSDSTKDEVLLSTKQVVVTKSSGSASEASSGRGKRV